MLHKQEYELLMYIKINGPLSRKEIKAINKPISEFLFDKFLYKYKALSIHQHLLIVDGKMIPNTYIVSTEGNILLQEYIDNVNKEKEIIKENHTWTLKTLGISFILGLISGAFLMWINSYFFK